MQTRKTAQGFLVRLSRGEKVLESLQSLCEKEGINAATFSAIGAVRNCDLGYYSFEKREYYFTKILDDREVASMTGNVALVDAKPFVHAHAVLSAGNESLACVGGHVKEAEVAVTLEITLHTHDAPLTREYDEETGLKLWNL